VSDLSTCIQISKLESSGSTFVCLIVGLYALLCMFLCSNPYISMICMASLYDPEIGFYGPCQRNLS
jgi:hypothetical protein